MELNNIQFKYTWLYFILFGNEITAWKLFYPARFFSKKKGFVYIYF